MRKRPAVSTPSLSASNSGGAGGGASIASAIVNALGTGLQITWNGSGIAPISGNVTGISVTINGVSQTVTADTSATAKVISPGATVWNDAIVVNYDSLNGNLKDASNNRLPKSSKIAKSLINQATPAFTLQPVNTTVTNGNNATLTFTATNLASYEIQYNSGLGWLEYGQSVAGSYVFKSSLNMSGYQFRVLAKNNTGQSTPSNVVTLTVNPILSVFSTHPSNVTVNNGQEALFSFAASNAVSYKAQVNTGSGWVDYAQNVTSPMSVLAATAKNGHQFRFVATSVDNQQATSNAATLTVSTPQVIQPFSFVKFVWGAITNAISIVVGNGTDDVGAYSYGNFGIKYNAPTTSLDFTYDSAASANVGPTTFNALVITGGASTLSID
jgi:hypothetical protein